MKILRDSRFQVLILKSSILSFVIGFAINTYLNSQLAIIVVVLIMIIFFWKYLLERNKQIEIAQRSIVLINQGKFDYDFGNFEEGELSILQTEIQKTMLTLKSLNESLNQKQKFLNRALGDISHQLKTPITSLILSNEILLERLPDEQSFLLQNQDQLERLNWLVTCLLKLVKLEADGYKFKFENISISSFIVELKNRISSLNSESITTVFSYTEKMLTIDVDWFLEALFNIYNNKYRYANTEIRLKVSGDTIRTQFEISDDGLEIPFNERVKIFERFFKGQNSSSNSVGIGMALSKEIVAKHNGKIDIIDRNTFRIQLYRQM